MCIEAHENRTGRRAHMLVVDPVLVGAMQSTEYYMLRIFSAFSPLLLHHIVDFQNFRALICMNLFVLSPSVRYENCQVQITLGHRPWS
jgi:hypothetical protein